MPSRQEYIEFILDHYENPRNRGPLEPADVVAKGGNPGCGDIVTIYMRVDPRTRVVHRVAFEGEGCTISQAAASITTELVTGKTLEEVQRVSGEDLVELLGPEVVSSRVRCATLGIHTARAATRKYQVEKLMEQIEADRIADRGKDLGLEIE